MKLVVQYVSKAAVTVNGRIISRIANGYAVLVGIGRSDDSSSLKATAGSLLNLRIIPDENGKLNRSILEVAGEILLIPQFTLYATIDGRRPSFTEAAPPESARKLFNEFVEIVRKSSAIIETGEFGANMLCEIHNSGPVTFIIES